MKENAFGISYDLEFLGTLTPGEEDPQFGRTRGRVYMNTCRYAQLGRARGWVKAGGTRYDIDEERFYAQRDHSWGIRMGTGLPEQGVQSPDIEKFTAMMINWLTAQFGDWGLYCYLIEKDDGTVQYLGGSVVRGLDAGVTPVPIVAVEPLLRVPPEQPADEVGPHEVHLRGREGIRHFHERADPPCTCAVARTWATRGTGTGPTWASTGRTASPGRWPTSPWRTTCTASTTRSLNCAAGTRPATGIIENMLFAPFRKYNITQWGFKPA